jgi:hypothetical protein
MPGLDVVRTGEDERVALTGSAEGGFAGAGEAGRPRRDGPGRPPGRAIPPMRVRADGDAGRACSIGRRLG